MIYGIPDTRRDKNKCYLRFWRGATAVVILFVAFTFHFVWYNTNEW